MRKNDVARVAGVAASAVIRVTVDDVRRDLADRVSEVVLEVATQAPATYWRTPDGRYWLDDPSFGDVAAFDQLDYDNQFGLVVRQ